MKQEKRDEHDHSHKPAVDLSTMKESPPSPKKEDLPPPPPPPPPPKGKSMDVDLGEGSVPSASTAKKAAQDDVLLKEPRLSSQYPRLDCNAMVCAGWSTTERTARIIAARLRTIKLKGMESIRIAVAIFTKANGMKEKNTAREK